VFIGYIILYPFGRFFVEMFRPDAWTIGGLATAQWIAIGSVLFGLLVLMLRHRFWKRDEGVAGEQVNEGEETAQS
jgi:phosphatidylglycerol:prolipoprotein diacylglycerol transferase